MTSSLQSAIEGRLQPSLVAALFCAQSFSCGRTAEDPCSDSPPPTIDLPADLGGDVELLAELSVDEWVEVDADGERTTGGMLAANFADMTGFSEEKIDAIPFGEACVAEVGRHVIDSPPEPIAAGGVVFRGIPAGVITLQMGQSGLFEDELTEGPLFSEDGGEEVEVEVLLDPSDSAFPPFELKVKEPPSVEMRVIETASDGSLRVEWEPFSSTYFEIVLTAQTGDPNLPTNRLRCLTEDDGCQVIAADAIEWLLSQGADEATVRLKRHVLAHTAPAQGALAELDAMRTLEFRYDF